MHINASAGKFDAVTEFLEVTFMSSYRCPVPCNRVWLLSLPGCRLNFQFNEVNVEMLCRVEGRSKHSDGVRQAKGTKKLSDTKSDSNFTSLLPNL